MHQRTVKITVTSGVMADLLLRLDLEVAPLVRAAPGFIAYFAVGVDDTTLVTTRVFQDRASLQAETDAAQPITRQIDDDFGLSDLDVVVDAPIGVVRCYGPIEEFTP